MPRFPRVLGIIATVLMTFWVTGIKAQLNRGVIEGIVTDPQGAVVPGVAVTITSVDRNVSYPTKTNGAGSYRVVDLVPGKYRARFERSGFSPMDVTDIEVPAGYATRQDVQLKLGQALQTVEVKAEISLIETSPTNFSTDLGGRYIRDLPLVGRDIQSLVQLVPGITQSYGPPGSIVGFDSAYSGFADPLHMIGSQISANGGQGGANGWYLDGSLNAAQGAENVVVNPSPDAVSAFNVVDNGLAAEWSGTSGAVVNVVLKSGTNQLHGNLYEFNRNSVFSATNPFSRRDERGKPLLQPHVNVNNFGGTLGGPVNVPGVYRGRDRTFFFVSYDVNILHETKPALLTVPLPGERTGDFRGDPRYDDVCDPVNAPQRCIYDPYSTVGPDSGGLFHRTSFPTPVLPSDRLDPIALFYMKSYPDPNFLDPLQQGPGGCLNTCGNFLGPVVSGISTHNISAKIDHVISPKHKLFGEWLYNPSSYKNLRYPWNGPTAPTITGLLGQQPYDARNQLFTVGLTSTFTPTVVNEARVSFSRQALIPRPNPDSVTATSQTVALFQGKNLPLSQPFNPTPLIQTDLGQYGPTPWSNAIQGAQAYTFIDNITKVVGRHTLKGGLMWRRNVAWYDSAYLSYLNFSAGLTSDPVTGAGGNSLAEFVLGAVGPGSGPGGVYHSPWQSNDQWGLYFQDEYRITPNFTLNVGLRYDVYGWYRERHDDLGVFNFVGQNPKIPLPGRVEYVATPQHPDRNILPANKNGLGPRFSFAWSPFGNKKTVVRGGYGIIFSNAIGAIFTRDFAAGSTTGFSQGIGWLGDGTGQRPIYRLSDVAPSVPIPDLSLIKKNDEQFLKQSPFAQLKGSKDPYVQQWSLNFQRQLPADMVVSVGYVGTHGLHLFNDLFRDYNHIPTAVRLRQRYNISQSAPVIPEVANLYGSDICDTSANTCPGTIAFKPYPQYGTIYDVFAPDGYNDYNSLQTRIEKRYSNGLNFILAYTIQKNLESPNTGGIGIVNENPVIFARGAGRASYVSGGVGGFAASEDPDNRRAYKALAPDDIPQILNMAVTYESPFGRGKRFLRQSAAGKVLGGWKLTQNWNLQSGVPLQIPGPCDAVSCFPNVIGNASSGRSGKNKVQREEQWFNPAAFEPLFGSDPATITAVTTGAYPDGTAFDYNSDIYWKFGNAGYRVPSARAPGFWNADFTLARDIHLSENRYFQFRWEVFNAFNHQNLGLPNTYWCLPPNPDGTTDVVHQFGCQFGKITSIQTDPRAMQFGLKFYW